MTKDGYSDRRSVTCDTAGLDGSSINDLNWDWFLLGNGSDVVFVAECLIDEAVGSSRINHSKGVDGGVVVSHLDW